MGLDNDPNLEVWYKFDESSGTQATDSSVNLRHGTLSNLEGTTLPTWDDAAGKIGGAIKFNGLDGFFDSEAFDVVVAPKEVIDGIGNFSVAAWVKAPATGV